VWLYFFQGTVTHIFIQADRKSSLIFSIDHKLCITPCKVLVQPFFSPSEQLRGPEKADLGETEGLQAMQERRRKAGEREDQTEGSGLQASQERTKE
jgi:hypothetical protein